MASSSADVEYGDTMAPPRTPKVVVLRRSRFWPLAALFFLALGAGVAAKFYREAEALKRTAAQQKHTAEQATEHAAAEVAAAVEQVRRAFDQAAHSDVQAREAGREIARVRAEMELARQDAVAQARRDAEDEMRKALAPQLELARAAASAGRLKISSEPAGADVFIDGHLTERSPATIEGLLPGRHTITLRLAGHTTRELTADIAGAQTTDLGAISLERLTGTVAVSSSPDELEVCILGPDTNGNAAPLRRGRTPAQFSDLPTGDYLVQFRRPGWPERTERITIEPGATATVATTFTSGTVVLNSNPPGAMVLQGGLLLGRTPLTLADVPPHEVSYELTAPGYEPLQVRGTVFSGRELELSGTLLKLDRLVTVNQVRTPPRPYFVTPLKLGRVPRSTPPFITVSFIVPLDGVPQEIQVVEPVEKKVANRLIDAVAKWKFFPGVSQAGYPVKVRMSMPIPLAP